jgi:hypothetical protein
MGWLIFIAVMVAFFRRVGWLILISVVLAVIFLPIAYHAVRYPPRGTSRPQAFVKLTVEFFGVVFASGLEWVIGLIGVLALLMLAGLFSGR